MRVDFSGNRGMPSIRCGPAVLRPISRAHATKRYVGWLNDPTINQYLETRFRRQTLESLTDFIETAIAQPGIAHFAIHDGKNDAFLGTAKLSEIKERHFSGVVGFMVGEKASWGSGIGTNAVAALCGFSFRNVGLKKIRASCYSSNVGSKVLLQKIGFKQEGVQRYQVETAGGREDVFDFGLTELEFDADRFPFAIS